MSNQSLLQFAEIASKKDVFLPVGELQKSPGKKLNTFKVITVSGKPKGFYIPTEDFDDMLEDFLAEKSLSYKDKITKARAEKGTIPASKVWESLWLN